MPDWLGLYHRLPDPLRTLAASARGYQLRRWRYGPETERLVAEAKERERWSPDGWRRWTEERLAYVLHRAATCVPYYREQWAARRRGGDRRSWEDLANWPILDKEVVRQTPAAFVATDCERRRLFQTRTSGSTGTPIQLWQSRTTLQQWYAHFEARALNWHGVSRTDRWAILGGQLVVPFKQSRPPYWVPNAGLNQLYLSCYHLAPDKVADYARALRQWQPTFLLGYPSAMQALAQLAAEQGLDLPALKVVISNAELLLGYQRETISAAFGCAVRDTYGMAEMAASGSECQAGALHLWPEVGIVEVMRDDAPEPLNDGQIGRLVCSGLVNADMPLIRYEVRDRGSLASGRCQCGLSLPVLQTVDGRQDDVIVTPDGRRIGRLDAIFQSTINIREAQVVQETRERVRVRVVPATGYTHHHSQEIVRRLRQRLGEMEIELELIDQIPRSAAGKLRVIVNVSGS